jgi:hypothetical protein
VEKITKTAFFVSGKQNFSRRSIIFSAMNGHGKFMAEATWSFWSRSVKAGQA